MIITNFFSKKFYLYLTFFLLCSSLSLLKGDEAEAAPTIFSYSLSLTSGFSTTLEKTLKVGDIISLNISTQGHTWNKGELDSNSSNSENSLLVEIRDLYLRDPDEGPSSASWEYSDEKSSVLELLSTTFNEEKAELNFSFKVKAPGRTALFFLEDEFNWLQQVHKFFSPSLEIYVPLEN